MTPSKKGSAAATATKTETGAPAAPMLSAWSMGPFPWHEKREFGRRAETPIEQWLSLFPVAGLFGVRWVGWDMLIKGDAAAPIARETVIVDENRADLEREKLFMGQAPVAPVREAPSHLRVVPVETEAPAKLEPATQEETAEVDGGEALVKPASLMSAPPADPDDLKKIRGVGPRLEELLNELGVYKLSQIAAFSEADLLWIDAHLTTFKGRALRDQWVEQAEELLQLRD